jgi:hypothetical protein
LIRLAYVWTSASSSSVQLSQFIFILKCWSCWSDAAILKIPT